MDKHANQNAEASWPFPHSEDHVHYFWTLTDEVTGRRRKTRYRMTEQDARQRHGDDAAKVEGSGVTYRPSGDASHLLSSPRPERVPEEDDE